MNARVSSSSTHNVPPNMPPKNISYLRSVRGNVLCGNIKDIDIVLQNGLSNMYRVHLSDKCTYSYMSYLPA